MNEHKIQVWAHRGASAYAPENTMEAYILAHQYGADGIELDVHLSKDGEIVVIHEGQKEIPETECQAVIVLGAGVNGTQPSLTLRTRLDAALDYLEDHPGVPAVLTGGQGYGENITEAQCMYNYLTAHGVDGSRLIMEEQATSTAENFRFSSVCLEAAGIDPASDTIAVVTNDFHLFRAQLIAAKQGYTDTFGVPSELPWWWLTANYYLRESFAMVKTLIFD